MRNKLLALLGAACLCTGVAGHAVAQTAVTQKPIVIGEINSYSGALTAFTAGYRKGFDLGVEAVNARGGVLGRPLQVIYRDDNVSPGDAVRMANELVLNQSVDLLAGTFLSPSGLAVAGYAAQHKVLFVATEPISNAMTWSKGSRYVFRVQSPSVVLSNALAERAKGLDCKHWAGTGPLSEASTDMFRDFSKEIRAAHPGVVWSNDVLAPIGRFSAGAAIDQFQRAGVDCIFSDHVGPDMIAFVRELKARNFFDKVKVVSVQAGLPEWLSSFGTEAPAGWIVNGFPYDEITWPRMRQFVADYRAKYHEDPLFGSMVAYLGVEGIAAGITRAGSTDVEAMIKGFRGAEFDCILQRCTWRADHQLNLGVWAGTIVQGDGKALMTDWEYIPAERSLPSVADGLAMRPAGAND